MTTSEAGVSEDDLAAAARVARERLGLDELRPGQGEAVQALLQGHDALVVFPSGYGKSAIYEIAGALLPGPTVVVSPLISLQRDQVEAIEDGDVGDARPLNSTLSEREREDVLARLESDDLEFVFLAPEQLARADVVARLQAARPSLFVVDEAHCISSWGYDFRPEYQQLGEVIEQLDHPTVLALTATAAPPVRDEIVHRLGMRRVRRFVRSFDRPNLVLAVHRYDDDDAKHAAVVAAVGEHRGETGIVYVGTRRLSDTLAAELAAHGVPALSYHAGMRTAEREAAHEAFTSEHVVIVATTAFGMGIDKPDVRYVFHADPPGSLDSYYQEIGRAGRDGAPADATVFYRPEDLSTPRFFAAARGASPEDLAAVLAVLDRAGGRAERDELAEATAVSSSRLTSALNRLRDAGVVRADDRGAVVVPDEAAARQALDAATDEEARHVRIEQSRVDMMRAYCETTGCRRAFLLGYFGEQYEPPCGACDRCLDGAAVTTPDTEAQTEHAFRPGDAVSHPSFGAGRVLSCERGRALILFEDAGYHFIDLRVAREQGLLSGGN